jgi:DNA-binding LytR/AlgR family response regulator
MSKIRVLIADDEEPARKKMQRLLENFEQLEIVGFAEDGLHALDQIVELEPDVVFLDIEMPGLNGLEVVQNLPKNLYPVIVFATAYQEYAVKAFELNSVDYLLKPISKERLASTIEKIQKNISLKETVKLPIEEIQQQLQQSGFQFNNKIPIPTADRYKLVDIENIILVQVEERITHLFTTEKRFMINQSLEQFEKKLPSNIFVKVNRSSVVNISHVKEFVLWFGHRLKLILTNGMEVICSRERSKILKQMLDL